MQDSDTLGLAVEDIFPTVGDTDAVGYTANTGGSRTAFDTGLAAIAAAEDVKKQMATRAALIWEVQDEDITFEDGTFICSKNPSDRLTFQELAARQMRTGGPITCSASADSTGVGAIFAGNIIDVEVDPDTGKVDILRCTAFLDSGRSVHPSFVEGQMQGGTVQGLGWALNEEYFYTDDGAMANSSFLDYRMPTSLDVPMIDCEVIEIPNPKHPYGLRGVGEAPIIPPLAAVANAVYNATGVRMYKLPISPTTILDELDASRKEKA
jgi:CO/xanthine dehydrogenase Mo-binding subunit